MMSRNPLKLEPGGSHHVLMRDFQPSRFPVSKSREYSSTLGSFPVPYSTPRKINMEHNHGGLEDHFPF